VTMLQLTLRQIRWEAEDIVSFELAPTDGRSLPAFTAGAHVDLKLPEDRVRSYSLVNDPSETQRYVIAVHRAPDGRGASTWLHSVPRVGERFAVSAPRNQFELDEGAAHSVFIAGGVGITPILSMLRRLNRLGKPWTLHYAARSPQHAAFVPELEALAEGQSPETAALPPSPSEDESSGKATLTQPRLNLAYSSDGPLRLDIPHIVAEAPPGTHFYCCGPTRMLDAFDEATRALPPGRVHHERFGAAQAAATDGGFEVVLQRSGRRIQVGAGRTILDALLDENVAVQYSCSSGICGTCRTAVLEGTPDHRDDYLSAEEKARNDSIMLCCSGSRSATLVLDL
jgi:ferredoxin-NADP reductase